MKQSVIFSGIQPSGSLTLGNYLGALKNWVDLQDNYNAIFSIVDLHAITVRQNPQRFKAQCYDVLALWLAAGIDPTKCVIFLQSQVPAHAELAWILNCYTYVGELNRMTQFKDKIKKHATNINAGLFIYPVLMAADILLYQANLVPIGADQKQHLELARDLAIRFNGLYGEQFVIPEGYQPPVGARIMSLLEPNRKMSKSEQGDATIFMLDAPEIIERKLKHAVTDSLNHLAFDPKNQPGVANLLTILSAVTGEKPDKIVERMSGAGYGMLKRDVAEAVIGFLEPLQKRYQTFRADEKALDRLLANGADAAAKIANRTLLQVKHALGFITRDD